MKIFRGSTLWILFVFFSWIYQIARAAVEEIEITPSNTSGLTLQDLSLNQFIGLMIIFLQMVLMYAMGVLPVELDTDALFRGEFPFGSGGIGATRTKRENNSTQIIKVEHQDLKTLLIDCPLQYFCDLDFWAYREHENYYDKMLASWLRNPKYTWTNPRGAYAGMGTCEEMYPCPFDVQKAIGVPIPGSRNGTSKYDYKDTAEDIEMNFT